MTFCATCTSAPVLGLRPLRGPRILAEKTPKSRSSNSVPATQSFDDFVNYRVDDVLYVPLIEVRVLRSDAPYQLGFYHAQTWIRGWQIAQMSVKQPYRLHGPKMQAPAWLPANAQDIDLAARLHSNGRCRSHRIRGMAARQIRQRCSRDSNSDRSCLASEFRTQLTPASLSRWKVLRPSEHCVARRRKTGAALPMGR